MRCAIWLLLVTACGGGEPKPIEAPENQLAPSTACPVDEALMQQAAAVFAPSTEIEEPWCAEVRVRGEPRWWLWARAMVEPDTGGSSHEALVAPDGRVLWKEASEYDGQGEGAFGPVVADLDGDGTDEVLYEYVMAHGGYSMADVVVVGLAGTTPVFGSAGLQSGGVDDEDYCAATWAVEDGVVVVSGCPDFAGRFHWNGSTLVEETAR